MPIHDWTRVDAGTFHDFLQGWTIRIRNALNCGILPDGYFAMVDRRDSGAEPDRTAPHPQSREPADGLSVAKTPPRIRQAAQAQTEAPPTRGKRTASRSATVVVASWR